MSTSEEIVGIALKIPLVTEGENVSLRGPPLREDLIALDLSYLRLYIRGPDSVLIAAHKKNEP
jgi:hypothetical protein